MKRTYDINQLFNQGGKKGGKKGKKDNNNQQIDVSQYENSIFIDTSNILLKTSNKKQEKIGVVTLQIH